MLDSVNEFFLQGHDITVHLFTDVINPFGKNHGRLIVKSYLIPSWGFPEATLYRYRFLSALPIIDYGDYIFYLDVDMRIVAPVKDEILYDIVAVKHPGFFNTGSGSWEQNNQSMCFTDLDRQNPKYYYAGGFQGGKAFFYYMAMLTMAQWINMDLEKNIMPVWHDESAWNRYLYLLSNNNTIHGGIKVDAAGLMPSYCMPEPMEKRIAWRIDHIQPKILALEKPDNFRK